MQQFDIICRFIKTIEYLDVDKWELLANLVTSYITHLHCQI